MREILIQLQAKVRSERTAKIDTLLSSIGLNKALNKTNPSHAMTTLILKDRSVLKSLLLDRYNPTYFTCKANYYLSHNKVGAFPAKEIKHLPPST